MANKFNLLPASLPNPPDGNTDPTVSIIIPVFNQAHYTKTCLERVFQHSPLERCQVIVVDNHSTDDTPKLLKAYGESIQIITNEENFGFATACNQGAQVAAGRYLLFLNNDTEVEPGWLEPLIETMVSDPDIGAVGSQLLYPDGTIQHAGVIIVAQRDKCTLLPRHVFAGEVPMRVPVNQPTFFQVVTAACMLVKKEIFQAVGSFDEAYWNGSEDVDFCFKLQRLGKKIAYEPRSVVIHHESKSGRERQSALARNNARLRARWDQIIQPDLIQEGWTARRAPDSPVRIRGKSVLDSIHYLEIAADWWTEQITNEKRQQERFLARLAKAVQKFKHRV
jgi:GT2 family glycosyltransferase